ncbi:hypothetical protein ACFWY9_13090 [Amycolatopsis sp. NPDC059027]|uniref:hypothetical protein n=1 Tax=unclassified Amycolatopsis TaxID=2618356 RepID=UPI0036709657
MSVSDFLAIKIGRGFDGLDVDGDGRLTENDHVVMGQRAALSLGYEPGTPAERKIIDAYLKIWHEVSSGPARIRKRRAIGGWDAPFAAELRASRLLRASGLRQGWAEATGVSAPVSR